MNTKRGFVIVGGEPNGILRLNTGEDQFSAGFYQNGQELNTFISDSSIIVSRWPRNGFRPGARSMSRICCSDRSH